MKILASFLLLLVFAYATQDAPPYDPSQFSNIGTINDLTVTDPSDIFSGGTITVDSIPMIIPKNSYVTLPSISVMWSELFIGGAPQLPQFGAPGVSWEATVYGNRIGSNYIVALVYITQSSVRIIQGFINAIDLGTGEFWVAGTSGSPGITIGRYGLEYFDHPLWTVDAESPSVTAATGFPLCIPRYANGTDDPLCPLKNRIINGGVPTFIQFKTAATRSTTDPDPNVMAPLMVGDYVTINGIEVGGGLLAVYSLVANLGIYTAPRETRESNLPSL
ncbi:hypothetical protein BGZ60DRAFT_388580 [Tricladium varicosporioides]|nr:hypothetical protein BGZ60DRAFT_388580 [Hymenoscyphus varicosporioides]